MKAPWFPFYTGDFLASATVQDMEGHEVGAYVLLMARSWQSDTPGYLEDDDYALRRAARMSAEQWVHSKNIILKKWPLAEDKPGYRYNPRLVLEAEKQVELREKKAEAGRLSAERRAALATQRQQSTNTNPTPVEDTATGVAKNGNYSQSQSQPQEDKSSSSLRSPRGAKPEPEHFAAFWLAYPRKEAKTKALQAFARLDATEQAAAAARAQEWFGRRADWVGPDGTDYRPHPTTWLNQKRWTDLTEITITPSPSHGNAPQQAASPQRNAIGGGAVFVNDELRRASIDLLATVKW